MAKDAEIKLSEILKTSSDLTKVLTYRPQKSRGKFINETDSGIKNFLSSVLGLDKIEQAYNSLHTKATNLEVEVKSLEQNIAFIQNNIQNLTVSDEDISKAKIAYDDANNRLAGMTNPDSKIKELNSKIEKVKHEINNRNRIVKEVDLTSQQNQVIKVNVQNLQKEINTLKDNICPTCLREWDRTAVLIDEKEGSVKKLLETLKSNISFINNSAPITDDNYYKTLNSTMEGLQLEIGKISTPINDAYKVKEIAKNNLDILLD